MDRSNPLATIFPDAVGAGARRHRELARSALHPRLSLNDQRESLLRLGLFSNRLLLGAVAATALLQLAVIYVPALNAIFKTAPLSLAEVLACVALAATVFVCVEIEKFMVRRGWIYRERQAAA